MTPKNQTDIPIEDVQKLHAESLQLRNQQFIIGTIALTGSGLSLWFFAGLGGDNYGVPGLTLVVSLISWFFILGVLFRWSLILRKIITIISEYLKISTVDGKPATHWEKWYFELPKKIETLEDKNKKFKIESQTKMVKWAFIFYGSIAFIISVANCIQSGVAFNNQKLCFWGTVLIIFGLLAIYMSYSSSIFFMNRRFKSFYKNKRCSIKDHISL